MCKNALLLKPKLFSAEWVQENLVGKQIKCVPNEDNLLYLYWTNIICDSDMTIALDSLEERQVMFLSLNHNILEIFDANDTTYYYVNIDCITEIKATSSIDHYSAGKLSDILEPAIEPAKYCAKVAEWMKLSLSETQEEE